METALIFQGGSFYFYCSICNRAVVDRDGGICAGCKNRHPQDPSPYWQTIVADFFEAIGTFWNRHWGEIIAIGIVVALACWLAASLSK